MPRTGRVVSPRHQHGVWERIASSFDRSRTRSWPHVERFLDTLAPGSRVLDLMAGNGRHVGPAIERGLDVTAVDWSRPLARVVDRRHDGAAAVAGDATLLPLRSDGFDACIYVAGLHGLTEAAARRASLAELKRVVRPGGRVQITVWSRMAPKFRGLGDPDSPLRIDIPWRADGHDESRTYHLYTLATLRNEVEAAGFDVTWCDEVSAVGRAPDNLVIEALA